MVEPQLTPMLSEETPASESVKGQASILNGAKVNIRKTHPNLYRLVMLYAVGCIALGVNFLAFTPTFLVYGAPNQLWGSILLALGVSKIVFMNFYRSLRVTRMLMGFAISYFIIFACGTLEPTLQGKSSAQLFILYVGLAAIEFPLLLEPFIQPLTARREEK